MCMCIELYVCIYIHIIRMYSSKSLTSCGLTNVGYDVWWSCPISYHCLVVSAAGWNMVEPPAREAYRTTLYGISYYIHTSIWVCLKIGYIQTNPYPCRLYFVLYISNYFDLCINLPWLTHRLYCIIIHRLRLNFSMGCHESSDQQCQYLYLYK